jgi:hypothetical protein
LLFGVANNFALIVRDNPNFIENTILNPENIRAIKSVCFGGIPVAATYREEDIWHDGAAAAGMITPKDDRIEIVIRENPQTMAQSLIHEVLHGILIYWRIDYDEDKEHQSALHEWHEEIVTDLSHHVYAFCVDNPEFWNKGGCPKW